MSQSARIQNPLVHRNWPPKDPPMFWATVFAMSFAGVAALFSWLSVREQHQSYVTQNRPYLAFTGLLPTNNVDNNGLLTGYRMGVTMTNVGNTPIVGADTKMCRSILREPGSSPSFNCELDDAPTAPPVIAPKQAILFTGTAITLDSYNTVMLGKQVLMYSGQLTTMIQSVAAITRRAFVKVLAGYRHQPRQC